MRTRLGAMMAVVAVLAAAAPGAAGAAAPTPGTISIEAAPAQPDLQAATPLFADAVGKALSAMGFTILEGSGHAALVAELRLSRVPLGTTTAKVSALKSSATPGGVSGVVGGGVSVPLPTGKMRTVPLQQTRLELRIAKRGEPGLLWQGTAITVRPADTRDGQDGAVAAALTEAILRDYPAQPDDVISVP